MRIVVEIMKIRLIIFVYYALFSALPIHVVAQTTSLTLKDIYIRDPFILPVSEEGIYYMYKSSSFEENGKNYGGVVAYKSKDLKDWEGPIRVFEVPRDNYLTAEVWAPEVHAYNGKYYLFATLHNHTKWKETLEGRPDFIHRGTQIFWSEKPEGPFLPFKNKLPHTPLGEMCLDGTLWVEDSIPYMIYCHEWVEVTDGEMEIIRLKDDLSESVGSNTRLFCASAATWSTGTGEGPAHTRSYVTDGCFLYRTKTNKLLMIWSSFYNGAYAVGIAESVSGKVMGPWNQQENMIFKEHGGHGMIFKTFEGKLCIVLHMPNSPSGAERAHIYELEDLGHTLKLKGKYLDSLASH